MQILKDIKTEQQNSLEIIKIYFLLNDVIFIDSLFKVTTFSDVFDDTNNSALNFQRKSNIKTLIQYLKSKLKSLMFF